MRCSEDQCDPGKGSPPRPGRGAVPTDPRLSCASPAACRPPGPPASLGVGRQKAQLSPPALFQIFGDYYHFWHRAVTKRSLAPHHLRHSRLQREPQVSAPGPSCSPSLPALRSAALLPPPPPTPPPSPLTGPVAAATGGETADQTGRVPGAHGPQVSPAVVPGTPPPWALAAALRVRPSVHRGAPEGMRPTLRPLLSLPLGV